VWTSITWTPDRVRVIADIPVLSADLTRQMDCALRAQQPQPLMHETRYMNENDDGWFSKNFGKRYHSNFVVI
jgi:hypothetical protein